MTPTPPKGAAHAAASPSRTIGAVGIAVMVIGAVLLLLSFTTLVWYRGSRGHDSAGTAKFGDMHRLMSGFDAPGASAAYFGWIAWVLLIVLIVVGFTANLPTRATNGLRVLGLLLGMVGSAFTYYALSAYFDAIKVRGGTGGVFENNGFGVWAALLGFLIAGIGAAIGPMRSR